MLFSFFSPLSLFVSLNADYTPLPLSYTWHLYLLLTFCSLSSLLLLPPLPADLRYDSNTGTSRLNIASIHFPYKPRTFFLLQTQTEGAGWKTTTHSIIHQREDEIIPCSVALFWLLLLYIWLTCCRIYIPPLCVNLCRTIRWAWSWGQLCVLSYDSVSPSYHTGKQTKIIYYKNLFKQFHYICCCCIEGRSNLCYYLFKD